MTHTPAATDASIIVEALAEYLRESHAAARPGAFRVIVSRLRDHYGVRIVDAALGLYERETRLERRRLKQENWRLERQWLKRQTSVEGE
jgi:hypothetical protein